MGRSARRGEREREKEGEREWGEGGESVGLTQF